MNIVLLGVPGAGKGTQGDKLVAKFGWTRLSTGDVLRAAIGGDSDLGKLAKEIVARGDLVPDDVVSGIVRDEISKSVSDSVPNGNFILDGFPRTLRQGEILDEMLGEMKLSLDAVIYIDVAYDLMVSRITKRRQEDEASAAVAREDDNLVTLKRRLEVFSAETTPLIAYYEGQKILRRIDGGKVIDEVFADIETALGR